MKATLPTLLVATVLASASFMAIAEEGEPADVATLSARVDADPGDAEARFMLAVALARSGRTTEALVEFERLLTLEPNNADYLLGRGQALLWAGRPRDALVPLEQAVALAPDYADAAQAMASARAALQLEAQEAAPAAGTAGQWVRLEGRHDELSDGFAPWTGWRLGWTRSGSRGHIGAAAFTERRFGLRDSGVAMEGSRTLGPWTLSGDASLAPGASVLARREGALAVQRFWPGGWSARARLAHRDFSDAGVTSLALGAERYMGAWRLAYTLGLTDVPGVPGTLTSHSVAADYFAPAGWQVGLRLSDGREDTRVGLDVVPAKVRSAALVGRHPLPGSWGLRWEVGQSRQGGFYDRTTLAAGLEYAF